MYFKDQALTQYDLSCGTCLCPRKQSLMASDGALRLWADVSGHSVTTGGGDMQHRLELCRGSFDREAFSVK